MAGGGHQRNGERSGCTGGGGRSEAHLPGPFPIASGIVRLPHAYLHLLHHSFYSPQLEDDLREGERLQRWLLRVHPLLIRPQR